VNNGDEAALDEGHDQWIKFDDDKVRRQDEEAGVLVAEHAFWQVSMMTAEKVGQLDGGGEDSAAYILLYRSKRFS